MPRFTPSDSESHAQPPSQGCPKSVPMCPLKRWFHTFRGPGRARPRVPAHGTLRGTCRGSANTGPGRGPSASQSTSWGPTCCPHALLASLRPRCSPPAKGGSPSSWPQRTERWERRCGASTRGSAPLMIGSPGGGERCLTPRLQRFCDRPVMSVLSEQVWPRPLCKPFPSEQLSLFQAPT